MEEMEEKVDMVDMELADEDVREIPEMELAEEDVRDMVE